MIFALALAAFLSAVLLFSLEPLVARMFLPLLGGSPAVWNTAMVFYQVGLLAGYAYAHALGSRSRRFRFMHVALMAGTVLLLPIHLAANLVPPAGGSPVLWMLAAMTVVVGAPFLLVSATAPLVQRWLAQSGHAHAQDPYFLYAASNAGSLLGLLAYPFVLEPRAALMDQSRMWAWGYGTLVLLIAIAAALPMRAAGPAAGLPAAERDPAPPAAAVTWRRRFRWLALAFAPSSLMLGVTTHLSTDLISLPLLWVIPLAVYLLTFVVAFAKRPLVSTAVASRLLVYAMIGVLIVLVSLTSRPILFVMSIHIVALFAVGLVCHGSLASDRPGAESLTEYYLWLAAGGALGGMFNALVAPRIFTSVLEYPLALTLACVLAPAWPERTRKTGKPADAGRSDAGSMGSAGLRRDVVVAMTFVAVVAGVVLGISALGHNWQRREFVLLLALLSFPLFSFRRRPVRLGLALGGIMLLTPAISEFEQPTLYAERSFFGIHRVRLFHHRGGTMHQLAHGTTIHGMQWTDPARQGEPTGYYHRNGPVGDLFAEAMAARYRSIAVVGLGTGGLSAYAMPGQSWTYFEIDPAVARIASDTSLFTFLSRAPSRPRIVLGDARLRLVADTARYDLIVLDAYSADAIPIHLLTREAIEIYARHLTGHGLLVLHLSNRFFDLEPVAGKAALACGLVCRFRSTGAPRDSLSSRVGSDWAVAARTDADLGVLLGNPHWEPPRIAAKTPLWTDDFASIVSVLR